MIPDLLKHRVEECIAAESHSLCDYFGLIKELVTIRDKKSGDIQASIDQLYEKVLDEILSNDGKPRSEVAFGTSGWRGVLGKDLFCKSIAQVTLAIVEMYKSLAESPDLCGHLGISGFEEVRKRGCVLGFDNRFGEDVLAQVVFQILDHEGIMVYYAGESTTGVLSASVLQLNAAFSINLTPSHNPLEYGGFKFNAADAGPAASEITDCITGMAKQIIASDRLPSCYPSLQLHSREIPKRIKKIDSFQLWVDHLTSHQEIHGLDYDAIIAGFEDTEDLVVAIDSVHGASRLHIGKMFKNTKNTRLIHLRKEKDVTFGGVAPEPSSKNMIPVVKVLNARKERLKLGAIIDPDGDRIRFTDGSAEIGMNRFGAMAYHFLHTYKKKTGMVAKTVATSNLANSIARAFGEKIFEPRVGFKEFKPVMGKALVYFEESDGISIIGHTPEKDAYIGLMLALDMILTTGKNLSEYLFEIEKTFGNYYPDRDGIVVSLKGQDLLDALAGLKKYSRGEQVKIGDEYKKIIEVIDIDGRKMIFEDGSWLMIRPSGTEPKVRFYVESRTADGTEKLVSAAKLMLADVGLV